MRLPRIALAKPPPSEPGAGVLCRNTSKLIDENPLINRMLKIHKRKVMPSTIAAEESTNPILLARLRLAKISGLMFEKLLMFLSPVFSPYS